MAGREPHWLNTEERAAWLAVLSIMTLLPGALEAPLQQGAKLSLFEYNVLAMLSEADTGVLPMSELAARTSASLSRLSHVARKLQARGYVQRSVHAHDARVTQVAITGAGMELVVELAPAHVESVRALVFKELSAQDTAALARIGRTIVRGLDGSHWILQE
ncbi:MarR family winged helix-turn-helix transcriptional regulator [Specibacter sp. NPDC057265]|uniref:MarR family winged helix-turn-helix transcriptional regulator n=1 Tax=Specibacter sp. NPDC057265 TaxID=3346075 RepID=UPI0036256C0C